jgi:transposase
LAVEVVSGETGDPSTLGKQIEKVRDRFGLSRVIWVGDRGLITEARIREGLRSVEGFGWITALRAPRIQELKKSGSLQLSLFDDRDPGEITDPAYPGERLIVCRNPFLTEDRRKNREDLLAATQKNLDKIVAATVRQNRPLRGKGKIALRVGKVLGRFKMAKHFILHIEENRFAYERDEEKIAGESSLDGIYIIRTSVKREVLETGEVVGVYKGLSVVEQAFRSFKSIDLKVRPIFHRLAERVRSHIFLCMLAYYVEWHMRKTLAPLLFDDEEPEEGKALRPSPVAPALKSASAKKKASTKRTKDDLPVHSFQTLLMDLSTITKNTVLPKFPEADSFEQITRATPLQQRALDLLNVRL